MSARMMKGRTSVVVAGGRQAGRVGYALIEATVVAISITLAIAPAGLTNIAFVFAVLLALSSIGGLLSTRRVIAAQAEQWPTLADQLAFERTIYRRPVGIPGYVLSPSRVQSEYAKSRRTLITALVGAPIAIGIVIFLSGPDDPVAIRIAMPIWIAALFTVLAVYSAHRMRLLQASTIR